jgi:chromosome segregation ATPase
VIEEAMIFALGFLVAGLMALAFAPVFWRRALRLSRRRLEAQVPLSVAEILADRDHLRAAFAVEQRRLEMRTDAVVQAHAADRSTLSRHVAELVKLQQIVEAQREEIRAQAGALAKADQELAALTNERGALTGALYDADGLYHKKQEELVKLNQAHQALASLADQRLANYASADARAAGLELRLGDVSRTLVEAEKRFTERTAHAVRLNDALAVARSNLEVLEGNYAVLQKKFDAESDRAAQLATDIDALRQQRDADRGKLRALNIKIGVQQTALEDAKAREAKAREAKSAEPQEQQIARLRESERALAEKYENLRLEVATLQGALDVARQRCETLEAGLSQAGRGGRRRGKSAHAAETGENGAAIVRLAPAGASPEEEPHEPPDLQITNQTGT